MMDLGEEGYTQENYEKFCEWWGVYVLQDTKVSFYNCIDMGIFICFMDICLEHSGIGFEKKLYSDNGEDKEFVLNAKYRLD